MTKAVLLAVGLLFCAGRPASAENRIPAGGAFMNSYTSDPYFDPRSVYSQSHSRGDIGGAPMLVEPPGSPEPCALFDQACVAAWERHHRR